MEKICFCGGTNYIYRSKKPLIVVWCNDCSIKKIDMSDGVKVISPVFGEGFIESKKGDMLKIKFKNGIFDIDIKDVQYVIDKKDYDRIIGGRK